MMATSVSIAESFAQAGFLRQADIQDAVNQEQVDEVIIHDADDKIARGLRACRCGAGCSRTDRREGSQRGRCGDCRCVGRERNFIIKY